jgi:hypothetical protein
MYRFDVVIEDAICACIGNEALEDGKEPLSPSYGPIMVNKLIKWRI